METLLATSTALLAGLLMTRVFKLIHLHFPDVTAFLLAGLLVGPYCLGRLGIPGLGFVSMQEVDSLSVISNTALGFIAFAIGNELYIKEFQEDGLHSLNTKYPVMTFDDDTKVYLIGRVLSVVDQKDIATDEDVRLYQTVKE